ncbi:glycosyltransferase family 4 protein [Roseomonas elaeocarpi]|uniref:Glycosyltransferase family 4 protein n=1 Tax=Roseomonas elaeocarpi TaxID=907779 RepID=A0ABV6JMS7_9PROT
MPVHPLPADPARDAARPPEGSNGTVRTALLTNFVAPYRVKLLQSLRDQIGQLRIFVSTRMEPDRLWQPDWGDLDVVVQKSVMLRWRRRRSSKVIQQLFIHVPYDTLLRLSAYRPDVVISGEMGARSLQAALYRRSNPRCRLIIWATLSEHTERDWGPARRALRRFILRSTDAVLVNGQSGARYIRSLEPDLPIQIVNQPVETALFSRAPLERSSAEERRLIFSGRLIAQKGVFELQEGVAEWARAHPEREVELVWAGTGEDHAALEAAPMPGNVRQRFTGHLDYAELAQLYATCGALILPTMWDEWGLVVNEAMASGLPVLGSVYSQAVEEMVEEGRTGWIFDPLRPGSLNGALTRFLDTPPDRLAEMRRRARERGTAISVAGATKQIASVVRGVGSGRPRSVTEPVSERRRAG